MKDAKRILLFGGTGTIGSRIADEATARGHHVTAVVRSQKSAKLGEHTNLCIEEGDIFLSSSWSEHLDQHDVVVSSYGPGSSETGSGGKR